MTPIKARSRLLELLAEQEDLEPVLRALDLWEAVIQVVPRRKVVATIDTDSILDDSWWIDGRRYCIREEAREVERDRLLAMCLADAVAYGVVRHMELSVRDIHDDVSGDDEVWRWGVRTPVLECLGTYQPLARNLEPGEDE
jgi:hypothetical protein